MWEFIKWSWPILGLIAAVINLFDTAEDADVNGTSFMTETGFKKYRIPLAILSFVGLVIGGWYSARLVWVEVLSNRSARASTPTVPGLEDEPTAQYGGDHSTIFVNRDGEVVEQPYYGLPPDDQ